MKSYKQIFRELKNKKQGALVAFTVIGDPDYKTSLEIIKKIVDSGADILELGLPFSDPIADGPTIQAADMRALKSKMNTDRAFDLIKVLKAYDNQSVEEKFEVIAVDDASEDETYDVLTSYVPNHYTLRVERMESNVGQGRARNRVIPLVDSDLVLFVGDDIFPESFFIESHLTAHRRYQDETTAVLGRIAWPEDLPQNTLMTHIDGIGAQQFSFYYLIHMVNYIPSFFNH